MTSITNNTPFGIEITNPHKNLNTVFIVCKDEAVRAMKLIHSNRHDDGVQRSSLCLLYDPSKDTSFIPIEFMLDNSHNSHCTKTQIKFPKESPVGERLIGNFICEPGQKWNVQRTADQDQELGIRIQAATPPRTVDLDNFDANTIEKTDPSYVVQLRLSAGKCPPPQVFSFSTDSSSAGSKKICRGGNAATAGLSCAVDGGAAAAAAGRHGDSLPPHATSVFSFSTDSSSGDSKKICRGGNAATADLSCEVDGRGGAAAAAGHGDSPPPPVPFVFSFITDSSSEDSKKMRFRSNAAAGLTSAVNGRADDSSPPPVTSPTLQKTEVSFGDRTGQKFSTIAYEVDTNLVTPQEYILRIFAEKDMTAFENRGSAKHVVRPQL